MTHAWALCPAASAARPATPAAAAPRAAQQPGCIHASASATSSSGTPWRRSSRGSRLAPAAYAAPAGQRGTAALPPAQAADPNERDMFGQTPLMHAALKGNAAATQQLLARGADVNARDDWGTTALMLAAGKGHAPIVRTLLQHGAEVDAQDSCGRTALMAAALAGAYTHMVNAVLARSYGFSSAGAFECTQALVAAGADVHAVDEAGFTPLARLAQAPMDHYLADAARLLLAAGAAGGPALEAALREENLAALEVLIAAGVDATALLAERLEFVRAHRRSADDVLLLLRAGARLEALPLPLKQFAVDLALRSRQ